jgi:hypothetical protein
MPKKKTTLKIPSGIFAITGSSSNTSTTVSGTNLVYSGGSGLTINPHYGMASQVKYHVLGEDVEVSGHYQDGMTTLMISTLNVLGKPFLDELHKNGTFFPTEIEEYLEKKFKWLERDKKIDDIIN